MPPSTSFDWATGHTRNVYFAPHSLWANNTPYNRPCQSTQQAAQHVIELTRAWMQVTETHPQLCQRLQALRFPRRDLTRNRHLLHAAFVKILHATSLKGSTMSSKIYVGNLPYTIDDASLRQNFSEFGGVLSAKVMMDRDTGRSKGFAFVEMSSAEEAQAAITGLNGMSVSGRSIVVNLSKPKEPSTGYGSGYRDTRN